MFTPNIHTPVLILGMHRSGTTMVADALNAAGVYGGSIRDHHAEALYAVDINDRLLARAGGSWWQVPDIAKLDRELEGAFPEYTAPVLYGAHLKVRSGQFWRQRLHYRGPWAIKDPRLSLTLPWWLRRFPKAKVIWVLRDDDEVVRSLLSRQKKSDEARSELTRETALYLVRQYNERASAVLKSMGVVYRAVRYEELTHEDPAVQRKLWHSLYAFCDVRPGQMEGFARRTPALEPTKTQQTDPAPTLPTEGPLVSIIVPNYNHAAFLDERLESILGQSYTSFELLLMDDCSTDHSREVLEKWAARDARITLLFNEKNSGSPFAQWAKGAAWAKGKYLWIAESDDACAPDLLATHVQALEANEKAVLAYSHSILVDEQGALLRDFKEDYAFIFGDAGRWRTAFTADGPTEVRTTLVFSNTIPNASGVLMRKSAFDAVGVPEVKWRLNGDWLFYARLLQHGDLAFFPEPRNYFRFHTQTQRSRAMASYVAFDEILAMYEVFEAEGWTTPKLLKAARAQVAMWWAGNIFSMRFTGDVVRNNWRLYRTFKKYRPGLAVYLIQRVSIQLLGSFIKAIGLKKPVKKWAARLFPKTFFAH